MDSTYPIKGRYIVIIWVAPFFLLPGIYPFLSLLDPDTEPYWFDIIFYYYFHFLLFSLSLLLVSKHKVNWKAMFSRADSTEYPPAIKLTIYIYIFSIAAVYALFYPLSLVFPDFVTSWLLEIPPLIYSDGTGFPLIPNVLGFLSLVVLAPVLEEFTFRGLLLHRWGEKYGIEKAIIFSSLLFGIAHPDPIGATAFGMAMSVLYLRTKTLLIPMFCHALTNFAVWCTEVGYISVLEPGYVYTLEDFQNDWYIGFVAALIAVAWSYVYIRGPRKNFVLSLPPL
jgi:membrane protease YdiL (CAAX protease family)